MPIYLGKNKVSCKYLIPAQDTPTPSSGGKNAVNFYDYDGTLLYSYTREEALGLSELPSLPDRTSENLTCQGWNYVLNGYVDDDGTAVSGIIDDLSANNENFAINVGAMYIPTDGATHINITMADKYRSKMPLMFKGNVTIDWGDGNTQTVNHTSAKTVTHEYATARSYPAKYTIKLTVNSGTLTFGGGSLSYNICGSTTNSANSPANTYSSRIDSIFIGNGVTSISDYAFYGCYALASVAIPDNVTSIGTYAFQHCYSLVSISIPNDVSSIGNYAFYGCYALASVAIPNSVISIGNYAFNNCSSLASVAIPDNVTSIGTYAFQYCSSLASVAIPNSVTSIGNYAFNNCSSLASVAIPDNVTSIGTYAFQYCYGIIKYDFSTHTAIPTLSNSNAFSGTANDKQIVVPDALYDDWIAAANWSSTSVKNYIIKASEYVEP